MSVGWRVAAGLGAAVAGALGAGFVAERSISRTRLAAAHDADALGALRGDTRSVVTDDGVVLHAEVDEVAPYAAGPDRNKKKEPTLIFVHGFSLNLDCWHFQRAYFRGKRRLVFFDHRSHGRSERSSPGAATIDQLGRDLLAVIEQLAPDGPVVLVGHSMGGMSIIALAEQHPELFGDKVVGVGLVSTTAGALSTAGILPFGPALPLAEAARERVVTLLTRAPQLVDTARRRGSNIGYVVTDLLAFGGSVPPSYVEFIDNMLASTPFEVVAEFYPEFGELDKFDAVEALGSVPVIVACGTKDRLTPISHSERLASLIEGSRLIEFQGTGHMAQMEKSTELNIELESLIARSLGEQTE